MIKAYTATAMVFVVLNHRLLCGHVHCKSHR